MAIDQTKVGETTARLMDQLEDRFGDEEQARIKDVFLVVAIEHGGDQAPKQLTIGFTGNADAPFYTHLGLINYAQSLITRRRPEPHAEEIRVFRRVHGTPGGVGYVRRMATTGRRSRLWWRAS